MVPCVVAIAVVVDDQGALAAVPVGVGKDVFVHRADVVEEVVEQKIAALGKEPAPLAAAERSRARGARPASGRGSRRSAAAVLHPVLFGESFDLSVPKHRQPGQRRHHRRNAKALVAVAKLIDGRALIRIAHEVHIALHDVRIELQRVLDDRAVLGVVLVAHHVHEGAVVDAMHAQGANEVALHQPEGLGQQQRSGHFGGHAVHHFAPELMRHVPVELGVGSCRIRRAKEWLRCCPGPGNQSR